MSVGEALAKARSQAGLTVDELSERTRIRKTVIRCIEHDDYDACGGDVFVRGYVRAIAGAVGIDARPLISEYNRTRAETSGDRDTSITHVARISDPVPPAADPAPLAADPVPAAADPVPAAADRSLPAPAADATVADGQFRAADLDATAADLPVADFPVADAGLGATAVDRPLPPVPAADPDATRSDLPVVSEDPTPTRSDLPVIPAEPPPPPMPWEPPRPTGAQVPGAWGAEPPAARSRPPGNQRPRRPPPPRPSWEPRQPRGRRRLGGAWIAVPAVLVLAVAGVAIGLAASGGSAPAGQNTALSQHASHAAAGALGSGKTTGTPTAPTSAPATPTASATPSPTPTTPGPVTSLHIANAQAFGPQGLSDGDNPGGAQAVISGSSQSPWSSQWYSTAQFGNLKQGTGLLIDMGHPVTITSVKIDLASYGGANVQVRVGDPAGGPYGMKVASRVNDVGGTVRIHLPTPQYVRYLVIWFTQLPPNGAGQYQATVYHVVVNGRT